MKCPESEPKKWGLRGLHQPQRYWMSIGGVGFVFDASLSVGVLVFEDHVQQQKYSELGVGLGGIKNVTEKAGKLFAQKSLTAILKSLPIGGDLLFVSDLKFGPALFVGPKVGVPGSVDLSQTDLTLVRN